ncbi:retrovirus-related pol polyprotein from transposon TNT 1-94 [Tanacetum coccineum]
MHELWATINKHNASYRFKINNKRFSVNVEVFREILNICSRVPGQEFDEPPSEEEALSFIRELGHSKEIKYITNVIVDHLHQPWRNFASIINKCLSGKVSGLDKIRLSRVQILWGIYYKKNVDFVALIWEDLAYLIDNKDSKKQDKMFYPRFTKIIIHHFLEKDKHEDTQVYGALLPKAMTNQAMLNSPSHLRKLPPKRSLPKLRKMYLQPRPTKKKALVKADRGKSLNILLEVALSEAAQLKEVTKQSKKYFHISHASGSGNGTYFQSGVPDEQQRKISGTDKGTSAKLGVPDIPKYDSESNKESWGDSGEEEDDDEDDIEDDEGNDDGDDSEGNDDDDDNDGDDDDDNDGDDDDNDGNDDDASDHERTKSDRHENLNLNQFNVEHEEEEEEENVDEFTDKEDDLNNDNEENEIELDDGEELYKDVNVNLRKEDVEMINTDHSKENQHNVSQELRFEQEEEDAHVTLTAVHDTQKTEGPMHNSSVSSDFTEKLVNFEKVSTADKEIASLMDTTVRHEEPSGQTSTLFTVPITTIPPPPHFFKTLPQQTIPTPTPTTSEATTSFPALPDFSSVFNFNDRVTKLETDLSEMKQVD